jgi:6,7-dimethyl-8-ribityllumazine synthase
MSNPPAEGRFAVVRATFYADLAERLTAGALKGFQEEGIDQAAVEIFDVPGAFELPLAAKACASNGSYAGVACLGAVIRGETDHYDWVCSAAAHGIQLVQVETGVPCAFGVLTVETREQALARSGGDKRDQGYNAALVVARMSRLVAALKATP